MQMKLGACAQGHIRLRTRLVWTLQYDRIDSAIAVRVDSLSVDEVERIAERGGVPDDAFTIFHVGRAAI